MGKVTVTFYGALATIMGERTTGLEASTLQEAIDTLTARYGDPLKDRVYDEKGKLRRFVNIYVNGKDIRFLANLDTELKDDDKISIIPAVGGG